MRAKSVFFHILILGTIIGTAWLGAWQLQRREWKHNILARLENSYSGAPKTLLPLGQTNAGNLPYSHKIITGSCRVKDLLFQPGRYHNAQPGYNVFCTTQNRAGENLLVQLGWWADEKFDLAPSSRIYFNQPALLLPFIPVPWWLPQAVNPHETLWPLEPALPAYPVYALLDANNDLPLAGTNIILVGTRPELPDDHLQYAITWFALAGVLLALYIYKTWPKKP